MSIKIIALLFVANNLYAQNANFTYSVFPVGAPQCEGVTLIFNDATTGTPPTSWAWNFGPGAIPSTSAQQHPGIVNFPICNPLQQVTLVINGGGPPSFTATQTIPIYCNPTACFTVNPSTACAGTPISFNSSCSSIGAGSSSLSYQWDVCNGTPGIVGPNPVYTYPEDSGCFCATLLLTNNHGCSDDTTVANAVCITIQPTITVSHVDASCANCHDGSATVFITGGGTPPYTIQWNIGSTNNPIINLDPGNYVVCVTDANGCSVCDTATVGLADGIIAVDVNELIQVIPNPNNGIFTLEISNLLQIENIEIVNLIGEKVFASMLRQAQHDKVQIDFSSASSGIYFLMLKTANEIIRKKILINN